MPKISGLGLGLGEIKKISGLGLGPIKKVSGLGLGPIWQDAVQVGMYKNGLYDVTTTQATVPSWTAEDANSTVSSNGLLIPSAGNYTLQLRVVCANTHFLARWLQLWIYRAGTAAVTGTQEDVAASATGVIRTLTTASPVACAQNDLITVQADAEDTNAIDITGGTGTYLRAIPA